MGVEYTVPLRSSVNASTRHWLGPHVHVKCSHQRPTRGKMSKRKTVKKSVTVQEAESVPVPDVLLKEEKVVNGDEAHTSPGKGKKRKHVEVHEETTKPTAKIEKRKKVKIETKEETSETQVGGEITKEKKAVRKRKTKGEKEAEAMPLASRTVGHRLFVGAHVSSAGGKCIIQLHPNHHD